MTNWRFFKTMRDAKTMKGRGVVLTTTNKNRIAPAPDLEKSQQIGVGCFLRDTKKDLPASFR